MDLSVAAFDDSGNILSLQVSTPSEKTWIVRRSNDLVDETEVARHLADSRRF